MTGQTTIIESGGCNHTFHLIMSIITFGLWIPVWIIVCMASKKQTTIVQSPQQPQVYYAPPATRSPYPAPQPQQSPPPDVPQGWTPPAAG